MKKLGVILIAVLLVAPVIVHAQTQLTNEFQNLNDNLVPPGWTQQIDYGNGGIQSGRLYARVTDATVHLTRMGTLPVGTMMLRLEYDGNLDYSSNGMQTSAHMIAGVDTFSVGDAISWGVQQHLARIWKSSSGFIFEQYFPLSYGGFHYLVEFTPGQIHWKCTSLSDASTVFDVTAPDSRVDLTETTGIFFSAYATTENDCWLDNIGVEVICTQTCDGFDDGSLDLSLWDPVSGDWTEGNGMVTGYWPLSDPQGEQANLLVAPPIQLGNSYGFDVDMIYVAGDNNRWGISLYSSPGNRYGIGYDLDNRLVCANIKRDGGPYQNAGYCVSNLSNIHTGIGAINHARMRAEGNRYTFYLNGFELFTLEDTVWFGALRPGICAYGYGSYDQVCFTPNCTGVCACFRQGDFDANGFIDVFDVIEVIGIAFSGGTEPQDPNCPRTRGDVDNNGLTDVFDVIYLIATAFSGGPYPVDPCGS